MCRLVDHLEELYGCLRVFDSLVQLDPIVPLEDLEEWNAIFEDTLFLIEVGDEEDDADARCELRELSGHYRVFDDIPEVAEALAAMDALIS